MKYVTFLKAGDFSKVGSELVFLQSRNRVYRHDTIFHRNDHSTIFRIPSGVFKEHFKYERSSGIYRTALKYKDLTKYTEIVKH